MPSSPENQERPAVNVCTECKLLEIECESLKEDLACRDDRIRILEGMLERYTYCECGIDV
jgi:hypothetical protein